MLAELDKRVLRFMRTRGHHPAAEQAVKLIAAAGEWGAVWTAGALGAAAVDGERRERWLRAAVVPLAAIAANYAVKLSVRRPRPELRGLPPLAGAPSALSFPSAHATSSFAAAAAMGRVAPRARPALFGAATAMALTRPYLGMHNPSDVLAGAALGTILGSVVPGLGAKESSSAEDRLAAVVARQSNGYPQDVAFEASETAAGTED
jgi:decaprenylphosphoryl-5-phosphoribose phosphatase